jgi:hypothetical protein
MLKTLAMKIVTLAAFLPLGVNFWIGKSVICSKIPSRFKASILGLIKLSSVITLDNCSLVQPIVEFFCSAQKIANDGLVSSTAV